MFSGRGVHLLRRSGLRKSPKVDATKRGGTSPCQHQQPRPVDRKYAACWHEVRGLQEGRELRFIPGQQYIGGSFAFDPLRPIGRLAHCGKCVDRRGRVEIPLQAPDAGVSDNDRSRPCFHWRADRRVSGPGSGRGQCAVPLQQGRPGHRRRYYLCDWRQAVRRGNVRCLCQVLENSASIINSDHFRTTLKHRQDARVE